MTNKTDITKVIGVDVLISEPMNLGLKLWLSMYDNSPAWVTKSKHIKSMGLAGAISGEIARMTTAEMQVRLTGSARADWLQEQFKSVITSLKNQKVEYALSRGGMAVKPFVVRGKMGVDFIGAENMYPISFDATGNIDSVVFSDTRKVGKWYYTKLEYHQMLDGNLYWIQNFVYRSTDPNVLGAPTNFTDVPDWAEIVPNTGADGEEIQYIANVAQPLYGFFRYPMPNNIDPNSPLGVSCFSYAQTPNDGIRLIQQADELWSNLVWEFESGKRAIYVDPLAFDTDTATGKPILPDERMYRTLNRTTDIGGKGNMFDAWSPEFREAAINSGLNSVLKRIEFSCRIAYGTLSDPQMVATTATEVLTSRQRSYVTVTSTQEALQSACDGLLYAMSVLADLYGLAPRGTYSAVYDFDDSVITDKAEERMQLSQEVGQGITSKLEYRMKVKREDEATAKKMLAMVDAERVEEPGLFETGA